MNKDEMNRAIAEAMGYKVEPCTCNKFAWRDAVFGGHTPDYASCLNACASFEADAPHAYWVRLWEVTIGKMKPMHESHLRAFAHASAPQRCEAFLRTLNLYQDTRES